MCFIQGLKPQILFKKDIKAIINFSRPRRPWLGRTHARRLPVPPLAGSQGRICGRVRGYWGSTATVISGGGGAVVTVASQLAFNSGGNQCAYIASKGAIVSFTKTTAVDFAKQKVRVNSVAPAVIDTPLSRGSAQTRPDVEAFRQWRVNRHPMGRIGEVDEVARSIAFLASDESSFTTGSILLIDGGWTSA